MRFQYWALMPRGPLQNWQLSGELLFPKRPFSRPDIRCQLISLPVGKVAVLNQRFRKRRGLPGRKGVIESRNFARKIR